MLKWVMDLLCTVVGRDIVFVYLEDMFKPVLILNVISFWLLLSHESRLLEINDLQINILWETFVS